MMKAHVSILAEVNPQAAGAERVSLMEGIRSLQMRSDPIWMKIGEVYVENCIYHGIWLYTLWDDIAHESTL